MGRLTVIIPDDLEERYRQWLLKKYGLKFSKKIGKHVADALEDFLDKQEP